jgi:hypothetical protein
MSEKVADWIQTSLGGILASTNSCTSLAVKGHTHFGRLELGCKLAAIALDNFNTFLVRRNGRTSRLVQVGAPIGRAAKGITASRRGIDIKARVHFGTECFNFRQGKVGRAARGPDAGCPRHAALGVEFGTRHDIRRRVQVALRMTTDQLQILGKCHVALDNAGTELRRGFVTAFGMFGELQTGATMTNGKVAELKELDILGALGCCQREIARLATIWHITVDISSRTRRHDSVYEQMNKHMTL